MNASLHGRSLAGSRLGMTSYAGDLLGAGYNCERNGSISHSVVRSQSDRFLNCSNVYSVECRKIVLKHRLHFLSETPIVNREVELLVNLRRARIKIRRADEGKHPVDHHRLGVNHRRLIFENSSLRLPAFARKRSGRRFSLGADRCAGPGTIKPHINMPLDRFDEKVDLVSNSARNRRS